MKPLVNLADVPFRNRRLFWLAILALFAIPAYFGLNAIDTKTRLDAQIGDYSARVNDLEKRLNKIQKPSTSSVTISTGKNQQLYAASELVARRAFSWSQLLNDIERNLPPTVRILRITVAQIEPEERDGTIGGATSAAVLGLNVIGKSGTDVTAMINKFHDSGRFKVFPISKKAVEGIEDIEFELKVEYYPPMSASRGTGNNQVAALKPASPSGGQPGGEKK